MNFDGPHEVADLIEEEIGPEAAHGFLKWLADFRGEIEHETYLQAYDEGQQDGYDAGWDEGYEAGRD